MWNLVGHKARGDEEVGHIENLLRVKSRGVEAGGHMWNLVGHKSRGVGEVGHIENLL